MPKCFLYTTRVVAGQFDDCRSADVIIITAGVSQSGERSRLDSLNETAAILKGLVLKVVRYNPHGILLIASNPVDVLTYAAWKWSGLPSNRVIGSGTSLDTSRFRRRLAEHYGVALDNVHAYVIGEHGESDAGHADVGKRCGGRDTRYRSDAGRIFHPGCCADGVWETPFRVGSHCGTRANACAI